MNAGVKTLDFAEVYNRYRERVDAVLDTLVPQVFWSDPREDVLAQGMRYSVIGGGKRLRPVLALAACDLVGGSSEQAVVPAAAIELIHTYSLIHDDLPCMDDDDMRRDKPTAHKVFGEALALLAGDALLTLAFDVLSRPSALPPDAQLRLVREVAEAAGDRGMVLGQVLDINQHESMGAGADRADLLRYLERVHGLKTGRLLTVSARLGALCGGCSPEQLDFLTCYAEKIGLMFQIQDDILDETGESACLGKNVGSDARLGKLTYVSLLGLEGALCERDRVCAEAAEALGPFGERAEFLYSLADYIVSRER